MRFKVFAIVLFITAVYGFSQEQEGWYLDKPIKDIIFTGLKNTTQSELEALINPYRGRIHSEVIAELYDKLWNIGLFSYIEPPDNQKADASGSEVIVRFHVTEQPVISRINFSGNSGLRRSELMEIISTKVSDIYSQPKINIDIDAIKNKYIEKGYPNANVQVTQIEGGDSNIILNFIIMEGDKLSIKSIEFEGNTRFSNNTLKNQLSLKAKSLLNDGAFQDAKLIADIEAIEKYYHDRGYIDAKVIDYPITYAKDEKGSNMTITFHIEEGNVFRFGEVTFEGNVIFPSEQLQKLINSKTGEIVNYSRVEADLQRVSDLYFENGYIFNSIIRTPNKSPQNILSYHIIIVERGRAYIENIIIRGNEKTRTDVILREIPMEPGDVFSKAKVMDAMRNLYNLQFFSAVIPEPTQGSAENLMDLVFFVEEQPTTDVQFGLTFSGSADPDSFPISGMLKWNDRNLVGTGNQLGAELNSSVVDTTTFSVNYLHRWIFGLPLSGGVDFTANYVKRLATMDNQSPIFIGDESYAFPDGFSSYEEYIDHNKLPPRDYLMDYMQWYISLGFSTGYRWSTFMGLLSVNGGMRFGILRNTYDNELYRPFDPALRAGNNTWTPKNSFWTSVSLDQRDIFYDPSSGFYLYGRAGFYGIFNNEREHYIRSDIKAEYFLTLFNVPVTDNWSFKGVLGLHSGLSRIDKQPGRSSNSLTPPIEDGNKLSVDGMFVGRGWSSEYRNKGLLLWENWVEMRFPIVYGILAFDLFFDFAGIESKQGYYFGKNDEGKSNFTIDNFRFSFGGGIRFTLPQFPFRISLAKRFSFQDGTFTWEPGALFGNSRNPAAGIDLVISFVLSY